MKNRFRIKTAIHFGPGALDTLRDLSGRRVLIVTDGFIATTSLMSSVRERLSAAEVEVFDRVQPNPGTELIADGVKTYLELQPHAVVAVGGGSSIDAAKAIYLVALKQTGPAECGFIAIPTTSGSGSEVTSYAVVTDEKTHHKFSLISDDMLPDIAILDPEAVETVPASITADTGMDVITHALETYVSTQASDFSDAMAEKAAQLAFAHLGRAHVNGHDMEARERMHNASCLAAIAFENAGLGITHSLSHALGGAFGLPHGRLNATLLPHVMRFNAGAIGFGPAGLSPAAERYARIGHLIGLDAANDRNLALGLIEQVTVLNRKLGMPENIRGFDIDPDEYEAQIPTLAASALEDSCTPTNPTAATAEDLETLLTALL